MKPLWSDERIVMAFATVALPDGTLGADEIMFIVKGMRDEYEAERQKIDKLYDIVMAQQGTL